MVAADLPKHELLARTRATIRNEGAKGALNGLMDGVSPALPGLGGKKFARARIGITYRWCHGRWPDLSAPTLFTEMVQWRKLQYRNPRMVLLSDKVRVKDFVAARIGAEWVIPTLWHGTDLPEVAAWPVPFVVKSRHGCNQRVFVRLGLQDWPAIRRRAAGWLKSRYGWWLDEWAYGAIPRGIIVEPLMSDDGRLPMDWKLFVFGGRVQYIQNHIARETNHRWIVMDRNWRRVSAPTPDSDPVPPATLDQMIAAAEELARGFDFVRVDMYEVGGQALFGELTFYPGSGLERVDPPSLDRAMGAFWLAARRERVMDEQDSKVAVLV